MEDEEADARAINAQPWEPPPGMVKRQCPHCRYFFAAPSIEPEAVLLCPDCAAAGTRTVAPRWRNPRTLRLLTNESGAAGWSLPAGSAPGEPAASGACRRTNMHCTAMPVCGSRHGWLPQTDQGRNWWYPPGSRRAGAFSVHAPRKWRTGLTQINALPGSVVEFGVVAESHPHARSHYDSSRRAGNGERRARFR